MPGLRMASDNRPPVVLTPEIVSILTDPKADPELPEVKRFIEKQWALEADRLQRQEGMERRAARELARATILGEIRRKIAELDGLDN